MPKSVTHIFYSWTQSNIYDTGSKAPAEQGTLIFMCAGDQPLYESVAEDLDAMGKVGGRCGLWIDWIGWMTRRRDLGVLGGD